MAETARQGDGLRIDEHDIDGLGGRIRVRDYHPANRTARTAFLWVHGGGFSYGGLDQKESDAPARALARSGTFVRTVDYRLAPKIGLFREPDLSALPGRFPAGLDDVVSAVESLAQLEGAPITLGGASAGGNLAAAAALRLRDESAVMPRSLVLAYGAFHAVLPTGSTIESELRGPLARWAFNPAMYRRIALNYVGDPEKLVPSLAFPGGFDLAGLPPTLSVNASNDRLRASGEAFTRELRSTGVEVHETVVEGTHGFLNSPRSRKFADGMRELTRWLASHD